jgi:hypothetical protein
MAVNYPSSFDNGSAPGLRTVNNVTDRRDFHYFNTPSVGTTTNLTAVQAATAATLPNSPSYSSGVLTAVGTATTLVVDGMNITTSGARILVKNQSSALQNGIYTLSTVGGAATTWVLTRDTTMDENAEVRRFAAVGVTGSGSANANTKWYVSTQEPITVGTTSIAWTAVPTTVSYPSSSKYPTDANVGVETLTNSTHLYNDFKQMLEVLEYEINAIQTSFASVTAIGASFIAASNILSVRNLKSKADKYVFELKRLRGDIDRMNTVGFGGTAGGGMGLTGRYPSSQHRGWGPN